MQQAIFSEGVQRIGLIADSHGDLQSIKTAVARLKAERAQAVIHLGDIFDSLGNDNLYGIYEIVKKNHMTAVKGNNDFQIENLLRNGHSPNLSSSEKNQILSFLTNMPLITEKDGICYAHSMPFHSIRSFYEPVDTGSTDRAEEIFTKTRYRFVFCGHSHSSMLFRYRNGVVSREPIGTGNTLHFRKTERYIVIVGSLETGECGLFDKKHLTYRRINLPLS